MNIITKHRIAKGFSQNELAKRLGVTQTTISFWETGKKFPQSKHLLECSELLDFSPIEYIKEMKGA